MTISTVLVGTVRDQYQLVLDGGDPHHERVEINMATAFGLTAIVACAAALEAYCNEWLLSDGMAAELPAGIDGDWLEKQEFLKKLPVLTHLLLGATLPIDAQPMQDAQLLFQLRNFIMHYKLKFAEPKQVGVLRTRRIALQVPEDVRLRGLPEGKRPQQIAHYMDLWPRQLACTEVMRWAHNTVAATMAALERLGDAAAEANANSRPSLALRASMTLRVRAIDESYARDVLSRRGCDPSATEW